MTMAARQARRRLILGGWRLGAGVLTAGALPAAVRGQGPARGEGSARGQGTAPADTSAAGGAAAPTLESILGRIGGKPRREAAFVERKHLALLDAPVASSGVLRYAAPDRLEKITREPVAEAMRLEGDMLVLEREGRTRSAPAAQFPGVAALVASLRDILAGDAAALERRFKVTVQGDAGRWQVDLLPSDSDLAALVSRVTLRGREDRLEEIETLQADGDRSVMALTEQPPGS